jgi:hypothetical protein
MRNCADLGCQNISLTIRGNEKKALAVIATVSRAGAQQGLDIFTTGDMTRCEISQPGE